MVQNIQPFNFNGLTLCSKDEVSMINSLLAGLDSGPIGLTTTINQAITWLSKKSSALVPLAIHSYRRSQCAQLVDASSCVALFSLAEKNISFAVTLESRFAQQIIYHLLGNSRALSTQNSPLSAFEQGLLSYVFIKILASIRTQLASSWGPVVLLKISSRFDEIAQDVRGEKIFSANYQLRYDDTSSVVNVFLIDQESALLSAKISQAAPKTSRAWSSARVAGVKVPLLVQICRASLTRNELAGLEVDDTLVLSTSAAQLRDGILVGRVTCLVGEQQSGRLSALLMSNKQGDYLIKLTDLDLQANTCEEPIMQQEQSISTLNYSQPNPFVEDHTQTTIRAVLKDELITEESRISAQSASAQEVIENLHCSVSVELARLNLDLNAIVQLKVGQILELHRSAAQAVDLVVAGKKIGMGLLVDIDGELGVRIISLIG